MNTNRNTLRAYWKQVRFHKTTFYTSLILMPLSVVLLTTGLPYFLSMSIGEIANGNVDTIQMYLIWAGVIGFGGVLANIIGFQALIRHESNVRTRLQKDVFDKILHKDLQFFVNEKLGALTSRYIDYVRSYMTINDLLVIRTLGFVFSITTGLIIVGLNAPFLAVILVILIGLIIAQIKFFTKLREPLRNKRKKMIGEIHGETADALTNSLIVKTFGNEQEEIAHLEKQLHVFDKAYVKDISIFGIDGTIRNTVMVITQVVAITLCANLVVNGSLEIAIAIFALTYLQRIATQIFSLGELLNGYDEALLQAAPMSDILDKSIAVTDRKDALQFHIEDPSIEFEHVTYHYADKENEVLKAINLSIPAGQKVGLVGQSGAGKTTITHLLLRFSDVTDGSIKIGGTDIRDVQQESLRRQIAYVPQESMLFHRSLKENISYGKLDAADEEIREAARQANALEFIDALPEGMDTLVGERGVKLSGGQRQRIAIARAILKDAPILILDEATSALDSESEMLIQESLEKLMKQRTSIVIAHRLSTIAKLDRIIVLENGGITEDGTHTELIEKGGIYAKLWQHQSGGFLDE